MNVFRGIQLGWERASGVSRLTRLGNGLVFLGERRRLPQRKGCLKCSRFLLLPQRVTFIQRVKRKKKKMTRCPSLGSLPSPPAAPPAPSKVSSWLVLGSTTAPPPDEVSSIEGISSNGGVVEGLDIEESSCPLLSPC